MKKLNKEKTLKTSPSNKLSGNEIKKRTSIKHSLITFINRDLLDYRRGYFTCSKHGVIEKSKLIDHIINKGSSPCKACVSIKKKKPKKLTDEFIQNKLNENGLGIIYLKKRDPENNRKGYFLCSKHGPIKEAKSFSYQIRKKNPKTCCLECKRENNSKSKRLTINQVQKESNKIFGFFKYLRRDVKNVKFGYFLCTKHIQEGEHRQRISNHFKGHNPCCNNISQIEEKIKKILSNLNFNYNYQKTFKNCKNELLLPFDFYIKEVNLLIEYDGVQHYKPIDFFGGIEKFKKRQKRDIIKNDFAKNSSLNFNFIRIPYTRKNEILNIITQTIKGINRGEKIYKIYSI